MNHQQVLTADGPKTLGSRLLRLHLYRGSQRMPKSSRPDRIRQLISDNLLRLGAPPHVSQRETLLIKSGKYCGHRIKRGEFNAVWFVEENEVKFFGPEGILETLRPTEMLQQAEDTQRTAA